MFFEVKKIEVFKKKDFFLFFHGLIKEFND